MKILFLDTKPVRRGAQVFIQDLKIQFHESGIEVERIFLYREDNFECLPLSENDFVLDFVDNHWMEKYFYFQPVLCKVLAKKVLKFNPDIILCNGSRTLKYASLVKRFYPSLKAKWVYRVIDSAKYWNNKTLTASIYRRFIISAMDAAVGVSKQSLEEMIGHYKFKKPVIPIFRAIDLNYFEDYIPDKDLKYELNISNDEMVLIFVGNLTKQKRPDKFVLVIKQLIDQGINVKGVMVGDGNLRTSIERLIADLNLMNHLHLVGYQKDVRPYLFVSNLLLLTSDTEGLPGVILEAAAMRRVSICTSVGGVREFIENDQIGIVLENSSVHEFVSAIDSLRMNPKLVKAMSGNAFAHVREKFDLNIISKKYLNFFESLLKMKNNIN